MKNKFLQGITSFAIATAVCLAFGAVTVSATETTDPATQPTDPATQPTDPATQPTDPAQGSSGTANALSKDDIYINYYGQKIIVTSDRDKQIMFGVSTYNKKTSAVKTSSWDVYDVGVSDIYGEEEPNTVVIDISNLNTQKDNYVQIKGDVSSEAVTLHILPSDTKVKMKFNPVTGKVENNKGSDNSKNYTYQYRTQYSGWMVYGTYANPEEGVDLSVYQDRGTTLYFRQMSGGLAEGDEGLASNYELTSDTTVKIDGKADPNAYKAPCLPGKEIKVAVAKRANGPKVTVNYLKNTVSVPKDVEYRINTVSEESGITLGTKWTSVTAKTDLKDKELEALINGGSIDAKTVKANKADSKITHVAFKAQGSVKVTGSEAAIEGNKADGLITASLKENRGKYTLELKSDATDKNIKYEAIVGGDSAPAITAKAKAIAKGATAKIANVTDGSKVWIHKVGIAKEQEWSTEYVQLGTIVISKDDDKNDDDDKKEDEVDPNQTNLQKLADSIVDETASIVYPGKNKIIEFLKSGAPTVNWFTSADYTVDSTSVEGVTISVTTVSDTAQYAINEKADMDASDATPVYGNIGASNFTAGTVDITVTFAKEGCTTITKVVTVTVAADE